MYLGRYTLHNQDVALVLNRNYGLVSPQLHVRYEPLLTTTKDYDSSSLWQAREVFFLREGHTLSCTDREAKRVALYTHPYTQEGDKSAYLDPSELGRHYKPEEYSGHQS